MEIKKDLEKKMERIKFENQELKVENIELEFKVGELQEMLDSLSL